MLQPNNYQKENSSQSNNQSSTDSYGFILDADMQSSQESHEAKSPKNKILIIIGLIVVLLIAVLTLVFYSNQTNTTSQGDIQIASADENIALLEFDDPVFSMEVPSIWLPSPDYEPGTGIVFFRGQATHETSDLNPLDITLVVESTAVEVLSEYDGETTIKETYSSAGVDYNYIVYEQSIGGSGEDPAVVDLVAKNTAIKGNEVLTAQVKVPKDAWDHYSSLINKSMKSLVFK